MTIAYDDRDWQAAMRALETMGLHLSAYKRPQLERRLGSFLDREGFPSLERMVSQLRLDRELFLRLHTYLTIHVTEFFRDPPYWEQFRAVVEANPLKRWRIWSAGCSWGAEAVTAGLILENLGQRFEVTGTDSDAVVLERARKGLYRTSDLDKVPESWRRWFRLRGEYYELMPFKFGTLRFQTHDVVRDDPPGVFDMVICRNVIIYFHTDARRRVLHSLASSLVPGGRLFLGATETFLECRDMGFEVERPSIYRKLSE